MFQLAGRPTTERIGCVGRRGRGSSLGQTRDPAQRTGYAKGRTCQAIMTPFGCTD